MPGQIVGQRPALGGIEMVFGDGVIEFVEVGAG